MSNRAYAIQGSAKRAAHRGMSLVELLVAIAIGALIVAAMAVLFANNSRSRSETERASRQMENGRYALEVLRNELLHAGYYGELDPAGLVLPTTKPDPCATDIAGIQAGMPVYVQGYDDVAATTLTCLNDVKAGTDVVVIRRVSGCVVGAAGCTGVAAGAPVFQTSACGNATELGSADIANHYRLDTDATVFTLTLRNCTTVAPRRRYVLRIYYVANNDRAGDGVPTLKFTELGAGALSASSLVQGVENLQLEYGLDTDGNGDADVYTANPDLYLGCSATTTPTCVGRWTSVVSAKVFVLTRSIDTSPGYVDAKTYVLGRKANGDPNEFSGLDPGYKRRVFQEVVRLQNPSGRRGS
jgi:type IV pilus assembly protein PilW